MSGGFRPEGEALRDAMAWLAEQPGATHARIEEASQRFGLSPLDAAVLFRFFSPVAPPFEENNQ